MNDTWVVSKHHMRSVLVLVAVLTIALTAVGCDLSVSPDGVEAVTPGASVSLSPATFCIGEILTATYDGGPQVSSCGSPPDSGECKGGSLSSNPRALSLPFGFAEDNLLGSLSAPADELDTYTVTYAVEWEAWSHYRAYRQPGRYGSGQAWTGRVQAEAAARPIGPGIEATYRDILVCDEETRTWRFGRAEGGALVSRSDGAGGRSFLPSGELSACAAMTQICIADHAARFPWRISVEGGPSVVLGGPGNPVCTDAFAGYHPDDIVLEPGTRDTRYEPPPDWGTRCTPGDEHPWSGTGILNFDVAGSTMCAIGTTTGPGSFPSWQRNGLGSFEFGSIELLGTARTRCEAALDPVFLADYTALTTTLAPIVADDGGGEPGIVTICDLDTTCGNGVCDPLCESQNICPADCTVSSTSGACLATCDPNIPNSCLAGLSCLPRVAGGDEYICYNSVICSPDVPQEPDITQEPGQQACACGDGVCEQTRCNELQQNCPADCGASAPPPQPPPPQPGPVCGDGACSGGETCWSCSADCGPC